MTDNNYKDILSKHDVGIYFLPLVVDCFGAWDNRPITFFKKIASSISKLKVKPYAEIISQLMEKISVCLMRANAKALLKRQPKLSLYDDPTPTIANRASALAFLDNNFKNTR